MLTAAPRYRRRTERGLRACSEAGGASNRLYAEFGLEREFTEQSLYDSSLAGLEAGLGEKALREHLAGRASLSLEEAVDEALSAG